MATATATVTWIETWARSSSSPGSPSSSSRPSSCLSYTWSSHPTPTSSTTAGEWSTGLKIRSKTQLFLYCQARSRLYRSRFLRANNYFAAFSSTTQFAHFCTALAWEIQQTFLKWNIYFEPRSTRRSPFSSPCGPSSASTPLSMRTSRISTPSSCPTSTTPSSRSSSCDPRRCTPSRSTPATALISNNPKWLTD